VWDGERETEWGRLLLGCGLVSMWDHLWVVPSALRLADAWARQWDTQSVPELAIPLGGGWGAVLLV